MNVKQPLIWLLALSIAAIAGFYPYLLRRPQVTMEETKPVEEIPEVGKAKRILAIHSYNKDFDWVVKLDRGFTDALSESGYVLGKDYNLETFYMDTKVTYTKPEEIQARGIQAEQAIKDYRPDLVFITDDNALAYVAIPYIVSRQNNAPDFVFAGINSDPARFTTVIDNLQKPGKNITGALERMPILQGLGLAKRLFPEVKRAVIFADKSESSDFALREIRLLLERNKTGIEVKKIIQADSFEEWKKEILEAQGADDLIVVVTYHQLRDENGNVVPAAEVVQWTTENNRLPELGTLQFHAEDGFLMSIGVSGYHSGQYAGELAARIFSGEKAGDIPIIDPERAAIYLNLSRAKQLNIQIPIDILGLATKIFP